jgi:hypothetical protein
METGNLAFLIYWERYWTVYVRAVKTKRAYAMQRPLYLHSSYHYCASNSVALHCAAYECTIIC